MNLILPEIKISISYSDKAKKSQLYTIRNAQDASKLFRDIFNSDTIEWLEESILLLLSRSSKVLGYYKLSKGTTTGTLVDPRVIYTIALSVPGTAGIMIAHNHPSGSVNPSESDIILTRKLKEAGQVIDINLIDHIIIGCEEDYYSFNENSDIFNGTDR